MLIANLSYQKKIKTVFLIKYSPRARAVSQDSSKGKIEVKEESVKQETKDFYEVIEKTLMTGSNRLSEKILDGLIEMLKSLGK